MEQTAQTTATADLLNAIYKNVKMASDALLNLMPKVKDEKLKNDMTVQLSVYEGFASRAAKLLAEEGAKPEEEGTMTKLCSKMGMAMNTMRDSTASHLAEMIIEGSTMGINDILKQIREAEKKHVTGEPLHLAQHLCEYEEKRVEDMKKYLQ